MTNEPDGLMVLVRSISDEDAVVVSVVIDVELADDECMVIPAQPPLLGPAISGGRRCRPRALELSSCITE